MSCAFLDVRLQISPLVTKFSVTNIGGFYITHGAPQSQYCPPSISFIY